MGLLDAEYTNDPDRDRLKDEYDRQIGRDSADTLFNDIMQSANGVDGRYVIGSITTPLSGIIGSIFYGPSDYNPVYHEAIVTYDKISGRITVDGFYPESSGDAVYEIGEIRNDMSIVEYAFREAIKAVDENQYREALDIIDNIRSDPGDYDLVERNCQDFVEFVIKEAISGEDTGFYSNSDQFDWGDWEKLPDDLFVKFQEIDSKWSDLDSGWREFDFSFPIVLDLVD